MLSGMSQRVRITRVKVKGGKPYLGDHDGRDVYSDDPDTVMKWLCDAWRCRFNQCRSVRKKHGPDGTLIPIGQTVTYLTDRQARERCPWLQAVPTLILQSPAKLEAVEWYSAAKRRKTLRKQHLNPGRMPRFKSRRRDPMQFVCWHDNGRNARFRMVNKNNGIVAISGQNPMGRRDGGVRWTVEIHVRVSQPIRPYTNVRANWTDRTLVFTNTPQPVADGLTGRAVGIDRGAAHQAATSDGELLDMPKARLATIDKEIRRRQKAQARKMKTAGYKNMRDYLQHGASKRFRKEQAGIRRLHRKARQITVDWTQKATTRIVREYDFIAVESLNIQGMTRRGGNRKRALNRVMRQSDLAMLGAMLAYKTSLIPGKTLKAVNPAYTSQTCARCGHVSKGNRESQAVFRCTQCGYSTNADLNAAVNILSRGVSDAEEGEISEKSMDYALRALNAVRHGDATSGTRAAFACEPHPGPGGLSGVPRL